MIKEVKGNALEKYKADASKVRWMLHGVNCFGVMGAGIAAAVRKTYPYVTEVCEKLHKFGGLKLGTIQPVYVEDGLYIVNAATQYDTTGHMFGGIDVDYDAVRTCFRQMNVLAFDYQRASNMKQIISFPLIGCGLAGGDWKIVSKIIDEEISDEFEKRLYVL